MLNFVIILMIVFLNFDRVHADADLSKIELLQSKNSKNDINSIEQLEQLEQLKQVGQSNFSVLFWHVYDIQLKAKEGKFAAGQIPLLLELTYQRKISKQDLIEETANQWKRFELDQSKKKQWLEQLGEIWPNVKKGDKISFYISENKHTQFYFNTGYIGEIKDAQFSDAFALIWLDVNGPYPSMTRELIGQ